MVVSQQPQHLQGKASQVPSLQLKQATKTPIRMNNHQICSCAGDDAALSAHSDTTSIEVLTGGRFLPSKIIWDNLRLFAVLNVCETLTCRMSDKAAKLN